MKKILFTLKFFPMREIKLAGALKEHEITSLAVGFSRRWSSFAEHSENFAKVYDFTEFLKTQMGSDSESVEKHMERLEHWQDLYGLPNLELFIAGDRTMRLFPWERNLRLLDSLFVFWERILKSESPCVIIGELSSAPDLIAWSMAKKIGVQYICPGHSRLWEDRFALSDVAGQWEGLEEAYQKAKVEGLSNHDREEAWRFLSEFLNKKPKPSYTRYAAKTNPRKMIQRLSRLPDKLLSYSVDKKYAVDYAVAFSSKLWEDFSSILRRALVKTKLIRIFDEPHPGERFILFPLHFQPEATTMVFAPFHENQLAVAENIAKSVPAGHRLYVKEHMAMWGRHPLWFYKRLRRIPSIKLIRPEVDIHDLLKQCAAVVTITSTTGLEAILYGKPVVVLGNIFYSIFDCVYKVHSYEELPHVLIKATKEFRHDQEEVLRVVQCLLKATYQGNFDDAKVNPDTYGQPNVKKIADFIAQRLLNED